jgi:hypothetical protein
MQQSSLGATSKYWARHQTLENGITLPKNAQVFIKTGGGESARAALSADTPANPLILQTIASG